MLTTAHSRAAGARPAPGFCDADGASSGVEFGPPTRGFSGPRRRHCSQITRARRREVVFLGHRLKRRLNVAAAALNWEPEATAALVAARASPPL